MADEVELRPLTAENRQVVERLWQLYRHDLSQFRGTHGPEGFRGSLPGENGLFHTRTLVPYFEDDSDRAGFVVHERAVPVGFVFVARLTTPMRLMGDFFVVRGVRGRGVARAAVEQVFERFPGVWEIPFQDNNSAAARFWRRIAAERGRDVREERRPVPGKPEVPPDVWITLTVA
jgi:predicted acetyltransferase